MTAARLARPRFMDQEDAPPPRLQSLKTGAILASL